MMTTTTTTRAESKQQEHHHRDVHEDIVFTPPVPPPPPPMPLPWTPEPNNSSKSLLEMSDEFKDLLPPPPMPRPTRMVSITESKESQHQSQQQEEQQYEQRFSSLGRPRPPSRLPQKEASFLGGDLVDEHFEDPEFSTIAKPARLGDRTASTAGRLRRQGFQASTMRANFAMRSIRRDSNDWRGLIKPFVADLAFRSLVCRRSQSEVSFQPYTCQAAVLFVDISGYSKVTAAIAHRGAHSLSNIVNAYLSRLLRIANSHGGDCCKFAGDAVLIVWDGEESQLRDNVLCAARCVMEMQEQAGKHPVDGTDLEFKIHCALTCGWLESEIFVAPTHSHMQRLYHSIGGQSLEEISELVDLAKAGQVSISESCLEYLEGKIVTKDIPGCIEAYLLTELTLSPDDETRLEHHVEDIVTQRMLRRNKSVEEDFIHPSVLRQLSHGGLCPTQIAQMRDLCVLFIAMTSLGSTVNWLMEVQQVLDRKRCPIVQIIDDDKGVHVVAAINLYESVPESRLLGLEVCRDLVQKQMGCAVGMATGSTFCGVTGAANVACRWDITGPPAVRAARLMQYALRENVEVALDQSVYDYPMAGIMMKVLDEGVPIKGSTAPITIYTLSCCTYFAAFRVLETVHATQVHDGFVQQVHDHITSRSRSAVVVTGIPLAGKKIICQRAAGNANLVPYLHVCDETADLLRLAHTMATWYTYVDNDDVKYLAESVLEHLKLGHYSRAHDECIQLVNVALDEGIKACFLVDRVQFLDEFSKSLMRGCLRGKAAMSLRRSSRSSISSHHDSEMEAMEGTGRICFLCVHVSLYHHLPANDVVEDITRSHKSFSIPIVRVEQASETELRSLFRGLSDMEVEDRWIDAYASASGYCAGYFIERAAAIRILSGQLWSEGKRGYTETSQELVLTVPPGHLRRNRLLPVHQVSLDVAMRYSQVYDELPPLFQTFCKVLTLSTRKGLYKPPRHVVWEVLNDLVAEGIESDAYSVLLDELLEMLLVKVEEENDDKVLSFQCPAICDVVLELCTPEQIQAIVEALVERLRPLLGTMDFRVPLLMADLYHELGWHQHCSIDLWQKSYRMLNGKANELPRREMAWWKEVIKDEIVAAGLEPHEVLGTTFCLTCSEKTGLGSLLPRVKTYSAPVSFGPMGHTLSLLCRNIFHEHGVFYGYDDKQTKTLYSATKSASERYFKEVEVVEDYLSEHGFGGSPDMLRDEQSMMTFIATPAKDDEGVIMKAAKLLDEFIPKVVENRRERLKLLIRKLRLEGIPVVVQNAEHTLREAYQCLLKPVTRGQAAQDALMTMATRNWKPKPLPEHLPILHYQTVARLRNKILKRLTDAELHLFLHQQYVDDLEIFLVVTPLIYQAQEQGKC